MASQQFNVLLSEEHVQKFKEMYPKSSLSWALDLLLEKFLANHTLTPQQYAEIAAKELREEITG